MPVKCKSPCYVFVALSYVNSWFGEINFSDFQLLGIFSRLFNIMKVIVF
jgi:hypothetical protein